MKDMIVVDRTLEQEENKEDYAHFVFPAQYLKMYKNITFKSTHSVKYVVPSTYLRTLANIHLVYFQEGSSSHLVVSDALMGSFKQ